MRGATGGLHEFDCEHAGFRCLCQLGSTASRSYHTNMTASVAEREREAFRYRIYAALVVGGFLAYPLLANWHPNTSRSFRRSRSLKSDFLFSAGLLFFLCGFAPFCLDYMGHWGAFRLGAWTNYFGLAPLVALSMLAVPPHSGFHRLIGTLQASTFALLAVSLLSEVHSLEMTYTAYAWLGMAVILAYASCMLFLQLWKTRRSDPTGAMCESNFFYGRLVALVSGLIVFSYVYLVVQSDPLYLEHPMTQGNVYTIFSWMAAGLMFSSDNLKILIGDVGLGYGELKNGNLLWR
jgi:hypothetical protein